MIEITSATNTQFKMLKSLTTSKGIKEHKQFLLSGQKLIEEFLRMPHFNKFQIQYLLFQGQKPAVNISEKTKITKLSPALFSEIDVLGTHFDILVVSFNKFSEKDLSLQNENSNKDFRIELICPLGDPRNLGALTRTAVGFEVNEIILTKEACHPFLPQALKASAGAVLKMNFSTTSNSINQIPVVGENYALDLKGTELYKTKWPKNVRVWVGEEGPGLLLSEWQKSKIQKITISTKNIESLNATVSMSLALWDWNLKKNDYFRTE